MREQLVLKIIDDEDKWEQTNDLWKSIYRHPPARNYKTVLDIYAHMKKITTGIAWNDANAEALENAVFDAPKVSKKHLKKMCKLTGVRYNSEEKEIDLIQMLATLIEFGIRGAEYICNKIDAYYELVPVTENLQENIVDLETIVSKVNTNRKNKRDAKVLANNYSGNIALWNQTINKILIDEMKVPELMPLLKLAGYSKPVKQVIESELFAVLPTFKTDKCEVTLFSARRKIDI